MTAPTTPEPLTHVLRPSLPWRPPDQALTECGLRADSHPTITRNEADTRWRTLGAQRASLWFCMTCVYTARRWATWDDDPAGCIGREVEWARRRSSTAKADGDQFRRELVAIARLVELHRDDFDHLVDDLGETVSLRDHRTARMAARRQFR